MGIGYPLGQAAKKIDEAMVRHEAESDDAARREIIDAMSYLAIAALEIDRRHARDEIDLQRALDEQLPF